MKSGCIGLGLLGGAVGVIWWLCRSSRPLSGLSANPVPAYTWRDYDRWLRASSDTAEDYNKDFLQYVVSLISDKKSLSSKDANELFNRMGHVEYHRLVYRLKHYSGAYPSKQLGFVNYVRSRFGSLDDLLKAGAKEKKIRETVETVIDQDSYLEGGRWHYDDIRWHEGVAPCVAEVIEEAYDRRGELLPFEEVQLLLNCDSGKKQADLPVLKHMKQQSPEVQRRLRRLAPGVSAYRVVKKIEYCSKQGRSNAVCRELINRASLGPDQSWTAHELKNAQTVEDGLVVRDMARLQQQQQQQFSVRPRGKELPGRVKDALARRDPDWAIETCPADYRVGKKIAPVMKNVLAFLASKKSEGELFIHGRDGELISELLRRMGVHSFYGVTSRPLTTQAGDYLKQKQIREVRAYLKRVCPRGAIHVDTGFEGSIPKWFRKKGFGVKQIWLVSSGDPKHQIPLECTKYKLNSLVTTLEEREQRLDSTDVVIDRTTDVIIDHTTTTNKLPFMYSNNPECFWARVYGAADALNLPRLPDKVRKST